MQDVMRGFAIGAWALVGCAVNAQVRCTMPNGVVIEQRLSNACPAGASRAETLDGKPAVVRSPTKVPPAPVVTDRRTFKSQEVTRAEFGGAWPLTVERGTLRCMYPEPGMSQVRAYLVVVDGEFYALNGVARAHAAKMGWRSIDSIWRDNLAIPGTKVPVTPLAQRAAKLC